MKYSYIKILLLIIVIYIFYPIINKYLNSLLGIKEGFVWSRDTIKKFDVYQNTVNLNQNQFDSLLSFIYNVGVGAFTKSTLLKIIKVNPNDAKVREQFMRWVNKGSSFEKGLTRRRTAEANLYFTI